MVTDGGPSASELGITLPDVDKAQSKGPATAPAKEPPKELTPADRAVNKALKGIGDVDQDLRAAGITEVQIRQTQRNVEQRIRGEFKELEGKDPLSIVETALENAAVTDGEKDLVKLNKNTLEWRRDLLSGGINELIGRTRHPQYELNDVIRRITPNTEWRRSKDGTMVAYAVVEALSPKYSIQFGEKAGEVVAEAGEDFQERFLRELGVLDSDQTLKDIYRKSYREHDVERQADTPTPEGPYMIDEKGVNTGVIAGLPTKIEGVYARIQVRDSRVDLAISAQALQRIQPHGSNR